MQYPAIVGKNVANGKPFVQLRAGLIGQGGELRYVAIAIEAPSESVSRTLDAYFDDPPPRDNWSFYAPEKFFELWGANGANPTNEKKSRSKTKQVVEISIEELKLVLSFVASWATSQTAEDPPRLECHYVCENGRLWKAEPMSFKVYCGEFDGKTHVIRRVSPDFLARFTEAVGGNTSIDDVVGDELWHIPKEYSPLGPKLLAVVREAWPNYDPATGPEAYWTRLSLGACLTEGPSNSCRLAIRCWPPEEEE